MKAKKLKLKEKLARMVAKLKAKLGCKSCAPVCAMALAAGLVAGCQQTPSKSQTLHYDHCQVYFFPPVGGETNGWQGVTGDLGCQQMANETGGAETVSPAATVSPDTDLSVPITR